MTTPLQDFLNEPDVMAFEDIEPITVKVGHIDDFTLDIGDLREAASNEAKIDALTKALEAYEVAIDEAEAIFGGEYADHYGPMFEKAMAARDARRVALSSHTEQEGK